MRRAVTFTVVLIALTTMLTGCVATELQVTNLTGGAIQFYSGHTKKTVLIPAGQTVAVPHTDGKAIIISQHDEVWTYDAVNIFNFSSDTIKGLKKLTLPLTVHSDGAISLPSGRKIGPSFRNYH